MTKRNQSLLRLVQMAILSAVIVIMGFTVLGSIPLGGPLVATIAQVPVVIGAVLLGTKCGCILGGVFGAVSCLYFTLYSYPTSFVFSPFQSVSLADNAGMAALYAVFSLLICFVPRILIGLVSGSIFPRWKNVGKALLWGASLQEWQALWSTPCWCWEESGCFTGSSILLLPVRSNRCCI